MLTTLRNAWRIVDLRKKILFTLLIVLIYRLGNVVPVPFVNVANMSAMFDSELSGTILGLFNMMSGNAFSMATIFALGIQPYINASIIIQLLTIAIPALERLSKEGGEEGKKTIEKITRYTTIGLGLLMGFAYYVMLKNYNTEYSAQGMALMAETGFLQAVVIILSFTAGATLVMWLGEQITAHGIGNGISMILFANIIARIPGSIISPLWEMCFPSAAETASTWYWAILLLVSVLAVIVFIIYVTQAERRIPVQYAKRTVGRKVFGGQSSHLPIKVNMSGVMPIIFAQAIASIPATIGMFVPAAQTEGTGWYNFLKAFDSTGWIYSIVYFLLIVMFSYFYNTIQFNPIEVANNLKKNGGFIPGFRPGKPTAEFIKKVISKVLVFGAFYLSVVALLPLIVGNLVPSFANLAIGGTSVIIVVGVALDTVKALETQMLMRHYKGFLD